MTDIAQLKIKVDTSEVKSGTKDLEGLSSAGGKAGDSAAALSSKFLVAGATLAGVFLTLKQSVDAATKYQNALNGLASVARYAGANVGEAMSESLALTKDGLLSTTEAATALKNLLSRGFSTNEAVEMINRFKDAAAFGRQSSLDFGQAVVSATEGIKNENSVLVDNAGVTKNVSMMWKEYAAQINKSVADLSQAEKRQAEFNGVLAETEGQLGNAALAANGADGANARLNKTFSDMSVTIGQSLTPAYVGLTNAIATGFQGATEYGIKPFLFAFENLGISFGAHIGKMKAFFDVISNPSKWMTGELTRQFKMLEDTAEEMRVSAAGRISGQNVTPVMGADSGKRRQDFVSVESTKLKQLTDLRKKAVDDSNKEEVRRLNVAIWVNEQIALAEQKKNDEIAMYTERRMDIDQQRANENFAEAQRLSKESTDNQKEMFEDLKNAVDGYAKDMANAFVDFAVTGKSSFSDMINSMLRDLLRLSAQKLLFDPMVSTLTNSLGGGSGGGFLGSLGSAFSGMFSGGVSAGAGAYSIDANPYLNFGGFRANGGSVSAGNSYIVGERGPELFSPSGNGSITANNKLGGSNVSVVINNNSKAEATAVETKDARGNRRIEVTIAEMVASEIKRSGSSANQAIGSTFSARPRLVGR